MASVQSKVLWSMSGEEGAASIISTGVVGGSPFAYADTRTSTSSVYAKTYSPLMIDSAEELMGGAVKQIVEGSAGV